MIKEIEKGCCPKCGYNLVKFSAIAECPRCDYEDSWDNYSKLFNIKPKIIKIEITKTQKKNLISRKLHKILDRITINKAKAKAEEIDRIALETFAEKLKERGVKKWIGNNYILIIK